MILRVTSVAVAGPTRLLIEFNTSIRGEVDVAGLLQGPVFEPLKDSQFFQKVALDPVCGTVVWPNGADLAPEALFDLIPVAAANSGH